MKGGDDYDTDDENEQHVTNKNTRANAASNSGNPIASSV